MQVPFACAGTRSCQQQYTEGKHSRNTTQVCYSMHATVDALKQRSVLVTTLVCVAGGLLAPKHIKHSLYLLLRPPQLVPNRTTKVSAHRVHTDIPCAPASRAPSQAGMRLPLRLKLAEEMLKDADDLSRSFCRCRVITRVEVMLASLPNTKACRSCRRFVIRSCCTNIYSAFHERVAYLQSGCDFIGLLKQVK
jgi:hypothetical protein